MTIYDFPETHKEKKLSLSIEFPSKECIENQKFTGEGLKIFPFFF